MEALKKYLSEMRFRLDHRLEEYIPASDVKRLLAIVEAQDEALESIREYWNQDHNEMAMADACHYAVHRSDEALSKTEAIAKGET